MARLDRATTRNSLPLLLAVAGLAAWGLRPGTLLAALPLLFCPGWGLVRLLSVVDRNFGVLGASLCTSTLVLGGLAQLGAAQGWDVERLGLLCHMVSVTLCIAGRIRLAAYDRWQRRQPPHPAPMPLWPSGTPICLAILVIAVGAVLRAAPLDEVAEGTDRLEVAVQAMGWTLGGEDPDQAGHALPRETFMAAATAALAAAGRLHPVVATALVALAALVACLVLVAEGISRLWGNRGAAWAMGAALLGLNPLAAVFLLGGGEDESVLARLAPGFDPQITSAISPFLMGTPLTLTLAFVSLLLFSTLSVLRRSSTHVPRLCALASLGLVLCDPRAAALLLPGWLVGILMSHLACLDSPDNDAHRGSSVRRVGEPLVLRGPFWRPALHITAGALLGTWFVDPVEATVSFSRVVAWGLLAGVGPGCLLFMPGVRHLNASPGREAYFFVGVVAVTVTLGVTVQLPDDRGDLVVRLLAMVLAVPAANGAMKIVDNYGLRALALLGALLVLSLPGPAAVLTEIRARPVAFRVGAGELAMARGLDEAVVQATAVVSRSSDEDAVLLLHEPFVGDPLRALQLLAGRALLTSPAADAPRRRALQDALAAGDGTALGRLRGWRGLAGRPLWAVHRGDSWPGFTTVSRHDDVLVERSEAPDIVLVTVSSLRADRVTSRTMPQLEEWARSGLLFDSAISPSPETIPGLATILTGLSPVEHGADDVGAPVPTLAQSLTERGYRTSAVVALPGHVDLLRGFEQTRAEPGARAEEIVAMGLVELSRADPRPLFLWCHVSDLELPYEVPADARTKATGRFPFPIDPDLSNTHYGVASFPPPPRRAAGVGEVDTATGIAQYDVLVQHVDGALSQLLTSVTADDLVVVTAPHGTSLVEHQAWFHHGADLFEPSVRVPLVVRGAGLPVGPRAELTSLEDVAGLLLGGRLPRRDRVMLESGWRPGIGTGRAYDRRLDPTSRGLAPRIWGERTATGKTLLTITPEPGREANGVAFDLERDPHEMRAFPADLFELRRIDTWRRQTVRRPSRGDDTGG